MRRSFFHFCLLGALLFLALTGGAQPVITNQPTDQLATLGGNATFSVMATGVGPFTYQWQFKGTNLPFTNVITTVAGTGSPAYSGDGGAATNALLNFPSGITVDQFGNIIISDSSNNRIRRIDTNGIITLVAGNGSVALAGDGGPATNAALNWPHGVAVDQFGNIFISDTSHSLLRMVDTNGIISTLAGTNGAGFSGDGGPAILAKLWGPRGIIVDTQGNIFIADTGSHRIRKIDTNGIINTVAGTNTPGFSGDGGLANIAKLQSPYGVSVDSFGNLLIADTYNNRIRKVDANGIISTIAGTNTSGFAGDGGSAVVAKLFQPSQVVPDAYGNLFIADTINHRIRKVDTYGIITTLAGTNSFGYSGDGGAATNAKLNSPFDLTLDSNGNLLLVDSNNHRVRKIGLTGSPTIKLNTVTTNNSGNYQVIVTSPFGTTTSSIVNLAVVFVMSPTNVSVTNGNSSSLAVVVYGAGSFGYQWYLNTNNVVDGGTNATLVFTNTSYSQAGNYFCVVSNTSMSITSSIVKLTVIVFPPSITTQPTGSRAPVGGSANLSVTVSGDAPFGYQWFTSSGRTATAVPSVFVGHVQSATVTDGGAGYVSTPLVHFVGGSGSGAAATATLLSGTVFTININNQGSGYTTASPTIQIDPPPSTVMALSNQTNATLTLPSVTLRDSTNYYVVVTNNYGSVTSATVFLKVFLPPQNFTVQNVVTGLQMNLTGTPSYPYTLQSATNLTPPISWKSIRTNNADVNGNWLFTDTNLNAVQKFYRALGQ